ncbi:Protein of unknown function (DUF3060) [Terriglobus roseus DSM 18391]|uniref:DUF3060 domain-containing protein n=1 Tax=Terriglobus roseus (strain DSM 18391 / NRRL B-41598 / KBS 63) TaxID=926566 RepID=I3ZBJ2_TERRK|nr:DUF3060 domain-containing protein [Terriglobus roseus]AFL86610.1 Protein of unknown function (DUF3060) [Terriglobus roseus DSM 18391]
MTKSSQLLVAASLFLTTAIAHAQREITPTDFVKSTPNDIVIGGNDLAKDVTCTNGNSVYVEGQHNEVQVHGDCGAVRIRGNRNFVWVDRFTIIPVEGNDNTVFVRDTKTQYSSRGNGNRFERSKH